MRKLGKIYYETKPLLHKIIESKLRFWKLTNVERKIEKLELELGKGENTTRLTEAQ